MMERMKLKYARRRFECWIMSSVPAMGSLRNEKTRLNTGRRRVSRMLRNANCGPPSASFVLSDLSRRQAAHLVLGDEETQEAEELRDLGKRRFAQEAVDEGRDEGKDRLARRRDDPVEAQPRLLTPPRSEPASLPKPSQPSEGDLPHCE